MIEMVLRSSDLARIRFAHSPVWELMVSLRALQDNSRRHMYGKWLAGLRGRLDGVRMDVLTAIVTPGPYVPDFLTPPPGGLDNDLDEELAVVARTEDSVVRRELDMLFAGRPFPSVLQKLYDEPAHYLGGLTEEMGRYWRAAIAPAWERAKALAWADMDFRKDQFARVGIGQMLSSLSPELTFKGDRLVIRRSSSASTHLGGRGLLLVPCVFVWPAVMHTHSDIYQPVVCYAPRGVGELSEPAKPRESEPLVALVGRTRASLLATLDVPSTTTLLARRLQLTPAAISQHLKILKQSMLVDSRRRGREVLYSRTAAATGLVNAHD